MDHGGACTEASRRHIQPMQNVAVHALGRASHSGGQLTRACTTTYATRRSSEAAQTNGPWRYMHKGIASPLTTHAECRSARPREGMTARITRAMFGSKSRQAHATSQKH